MIDFVAQCGIVLKFATVSYLAVAIGCSAAPPSFEQTSPLDAPHTRQQWIDRLETPEYAKRAAQELEKLVGERGVHDAIAPLVTAWERDEKPPELLRAAVTIARDGVGGPYWAQITPALRRAVTDVVTNDIRSLMSALTAIDALTSVRDTGSLRVFIEIAQRSVPDLSPSNRLRLATIKALGQFGEQPQAIGALVSLLKIEPSHRVQVIPAAAALALANTRSPSAVVPLLQAIVRIPAIYPQCRRALVALGKPVVPELIKLLEGNQPEVQQVASDLRLNVHCERGMGLGTSCPMPSLLQYRAATLLGDFHDSGALQPLLTALAMPPVPAFFSRRGPGPDQHQAILRGLRRLGDASAAPAVWEYARNPLIKAENRAAAIETYAALSSDESALPEMAAMLVDTSLDAKLRATVAMAYARLVRADSALAPVVDLLAGMGAPETAKGEQYGREYQLLARASVGATCKRDPHCYARVLAQDTGALTDPLTAHIKDLQDWPDEAKEQLANAARERALLELGKLGASARTVVDTLLERTASTDPALRRGALTALTRVAALPCDTCVARLDEIITAERENVSLASLFIETQLTRDYFIWAGR